MNKGNLIDRYIFDVGRRLPAKNRQDVQMELRSALQDALDERGIDPANPQHEDRLVELLREFGEPSRVAGGYGTRRFIVGPELQPTYWLVLRIAAFGVIVGQLVSIIVTATQREAIDLPDTIGNFVGGFITAFAVVSLIFAILEYFLPELDLPSAAWQYGSAKAYQGGGWDPRTLPELTLDYDKINVFEIVVEMVFTTAFIYVINAFSGWDLPGRIGSGDGTTATVVAQLIGELQPFIPWITVSAIANIGIRVWLLLRGRWDPWTRWAEIAYYVGSAIILALILAAAPYTGNELVDNIAGLSIGISLIICIIYTAAMLWRVLRPKDLLPWDASRFEHDIEELGRKGEAITKAIETKLKKSKEK